MANPIIELLAALIQLYKYVLIAAVIMSLLISFNIVNRYEPLVQRIDYALRRLTDPVLRPIRKYLPDLGGIDISPIIVFLLLDFLQRSLFYYF